MEIHKYIPLRPYHTSIIIIHKTNQPLRPILNWRNATVYSLSKVFTQPITPLPYIFKIKNTTQLIQALKDNPILPTYKFASLYKPNIYSNIPITETRHIPTDIMELNILDPHIK